MLAEYKGLLLWKDFPPDFARFLEKKIRKKS